MKTIIIIILAIVIGLALIGGGVSSFFSDVGKGVEKIEEAGIIQDAIASGQALISDVFKDQTASLENIPEGVSREQMQIATRIKELTDKGKEITANEYKELDTLIETYQRNWGK